MTPEVHNVLSILTAPLRWRRVRFMMALLLGLSACSAYPPVNEGRGDASKKIANSAAVPAAPTPAAQSATPTVTAPKPAPDNVAANPPPQSPAAAPAATPVAPLPFEQAVGRWAMRPAFWSSIP